MATLAVKRKETKRHLPTATSTSVTNAVSPVTGSNVLSRLTITKEEAMEEEGAERGEERPEQAALHYSQVMSDPSDVLIEMRQLHDDMVSLLAASKDENGTSIIIEEGMKSEERPREEFDLTKAGRLPHDTYSLLAIVPVRSMAFVVSIAVFIIQTIALVLLWLDFTDSADLSNRLSMPVYVTWPLRVAQLVGVVMAAVSETEVADSLFILQNGYDEANFSRVLQIHYAQQNTKLAVARELGGGGSSSNTTGKNEDVGSISPVSSPISQPSESLSSMLSVDLSSRPTVQPGDVPIDVPSSEIQPSIEIPRCLQLRWFFSNFLRMVQGVCNLSCNFILIMRSTDVRFVLLSYGAVEFVNDINIRTFKLLALGFYGKGPIHHCRCKILTTLSSIDDQYRDNWRFGKKVRITSLTSVTIFVALLASWWTLSSRQATGQYLPKTIYVQFGAEPSQTLYLYSGEYELQMRSHNYFPTTGAVIYKERTPTGDYSSYFMYCDAEESWVFFPKEPKPAQGKRGVHPCRQAWLAKSSRVNSYDILSTSSVEWSVQVEDRFSGQAVESVMWDFRMKKERKCDNSEGDTYGPLCEFYVRCEKLKIPSGTFLELPDGFRTFQLHGVNIADDDIVWKDYNATLNDVNRTYGLEIYDVYKVLRYPMGGAVLVYDRPVYYNKMGMLKNRSDLSVYSIILSTGRYYGRFVVVVPDEEGVSGENDQERMDRTSLDLYQLLMRGTQQTCGYEGKPQRWMCGYDDIWTLLLRFVTHVTDKYVLLNPDSDTGNAISMQWNVIDRNKRIVRTRVSGQFSCADELLGSRTRLYM